MNRAYLEEKVYIFKWDKDSTRQATIVFIFNNGLWWFSKCTYNTLNDMYDMDDWEFMLDLSSEVIRLNGEANRK